MALPEAAAVQPDSRKEGAASSERARFGWRRRVLLGLLVAALLLVRADTLGLSPATAAGSAHLFSVLQWEVTHFLRKWTHLLWEALPGNTPDRLERRAIIDEYLVLARMVKKEEDRLEGPFAGRGSVTTPGGVTKGTARLSSGYLDELTASKEALRGWAEEAVEAEVSAVLIDEGFGSRVGLIFPPVDIWFGEPPTVLVTSPRDRIERLETILLLPDIEPIERDRIETEILKQYDLSSLVVDLGGLATYPTLVSDLDRLRGVLRTAAHEWLHAYLFFRPLGWNIFSSPDMVTLNESAADLAGRELGDVAFVGMGGDLADSARQFLPAEERNPFFSSYIRETRVRVEELLDEGRVDEAEEYMKERWWRLRLGGYGVRKLNQAFFAFHGVYASSAASISPIGGQLEEMRSLVPSMGSFIKTLSRVSTYAEFLELLEGLRADAAK